MALHRTHTVLKVGVRLEWLPLEAIAYSYCEAENRLTLAPGAEFLGWDATALGLPHADDALLNSPLGSDRAVLHDIDFHHWIGTGAYPERHHPGLGCTVIDAHPLAATAGATSPPNPQVVMVRALAPMVEPAMALLQQVWAVWWAHFWPFEAQQPRIWAM